MRAEATLSHTAARALYDRIGRWQDTQRFYEDDATADLFARSDLRHAQSVFEFGSGTGRLAERLLRDHLPATARYQGIDISSSCDLHPAPPVPCRRDDEGHRLV